MEESRKLLAAASPVASGDSEPAGLGSWQPGANVIALSFLSLYRITNKLRYLYILL